MLLETWQDLSCSQCAGVRFVVTQTLRVKSGGGMTATPVGYQCASCHAQVDIQQMQREAIVARKRQELAALQAEVGLA